MSDDVNKSSGAQDNAAPEEEVMFAVTRSNAIIVALVVVAFGLIVYSLGNDNTEAVQPAAVAVAEEITTPQMVVETEAVVAQPAPAAAPSPAPAPVSRPAPTPAPAPAPVTMASAGGAEIQRFNEGRLFYTSISIPANAETLYLSGSGASPKEDGSWGNMEEQTINTFTKFKQTLESQGWSMSDIVQVRAFAVAGDYGLLDFDGFNRGYQQFFGTQENPMKPVRSFVQVADLVVDGWLVEIEIRAARVPGKS